MITAINQHAHVAVADVRQLVAEHRLDLGIVEAPCNRPDVTVTEYCFSFIAACERR